MVSASQRAKEASKTFDTLFGSSEGGEGQEEPNDKTENTKTAEQADDKKQAELEL